MADLVITAANVVADASARVSHGTAGVAVTAGQTVYLDPATSTYKLADSNGAAEVRVPDGVALHAAAAGQPLAVAEKGPVTIGAALTAGVAYYQSDTPGGICPVADVGSGEYSTIVGIATSASVLKIGIQASGAAL
jgi:hypothetical protein